MRQWVNSVIDDGPKNSLPIWDREAFIITVPLKHLKHSNKCGLNYSRDIAIYFPNGNDEPEKSL